MSIIPKHLTRTEQQILDKIKESFLLCNPVATRACHVTEDRSRKTGEKHLQKIYKKYGVHCFVQLCCVIWKEHMELEVAKIRIQNKNIPININTPIDTYVIERAPSLPLPC